MMLRQPYPKSPVSILVIMEVTLKYHAHHNHIRGSPQFQSLL